MPLSLNKIKLLRSLQQKKFRQKYNFFTAEGPKICAEAIHADSLQLIEIFALEKWVNDHNLDYQKSQSKVTIVSEKELKKISALKTPNLVVLQAKIPDLTVNHSLMKSGAHIFCDRIMDPGNLGTIIRTAEWFGISSITLNIACVDPYNPKTIQATMGSILRMPISIIDKDLGAYFSSFKHIYGAAVDGKDIYTSELPSHSCFIIGNESQGISEEISKFCTKHLSIPRNQNSNTESLNAAVATGIICSEWSRRR